MAKLSLGLSPPVLPPGMVYFPEFITAEEQRPESMSFRIGTAGWCIDKHFRSMFSLEGSHLERYGSLFNCVEINSSFYREHRPKTYLRWAQSVPEDFLFSVKLSQLFTHEQGLRFKESELRTCVDSFCHLEEKLGVVLVQLPPKLEFDLKTAEKFLVSLRAMLTCGIALEPRHTTWAHPDARKLLLDVGISKVLADPERCPGGPSGAGGFKYLRYHGSPVIYRSAYSKAVLKELIGELESSPGSWCIFDNTTFGVATINALELIDLLGPVRRVA